MRRTLAVLITAGAFLVPAGAASAAEAHTNASCSNGKTGNYDRQDGHEYNRLGNVSRAADCGAPSEVPDVKGPVGWDKKHGGYTPGDGDKDPNGGGVL